MNLGSGVLVPEKAGSRWMQCLVTAVKALGSGSKEAPCPQCCESVPPLEVHLQFTAVCLQAWGLAGSWICKLRC